MYTINRFLFLFHWSLQFLKTIGITWLTAQEVQHSTVHVRNSEYKHSQLCM